MGDDNSGAHLGFSYGRCPNFRKGAKQYKTKKKRIKWHIFFLITRELEDMKLGTHMILHKKIFFKEVKPNQFLRI